MNYEDELYHHGIIGQRWGIRRFQNLDGSLTDEGRERYGVARARQKALNRQFRPKLNSAKNMHRRELVKEHTIPAGTRIYRTTTTKNETMDGNKYVSYLNADRNHYKGGIVRRSTGAGRGDEDGKYAYEKEYELTEDLKVPSRDKVYGVIAKYVDGNESKINDICKHRASMLLGFDMDKLSEMAQENEQYMRADMFAKQYVQRLVENYKDVPSNVAGFYAAQSFWKNVPLREAVFDELKKEGYNAIVDEASVGGQGGFRKEGVDPLIVFDAGSCLREVKTKKIGQMAENRARFMDVEFQVKATQGTGKWSAID